MIYTDYQKAAAKHLNTCKTILDSLDRLMHMDNNAFVVARYKIDSLHNIYYLSGYTLEAISTYSIYKHFGWNIKNSVKIYDQRFSDVSEFDFYGGADRWGKIRSIYSAKSHLFQINQFEILRKEFGSSGIEFIDRSVEIKTNIKILFNSWRAEIRYHKASNPYINNVQLSENDVRTFVSVTENIYNSLLEIIG